ncbi:HNH endonuclease signature motif containing protein [Sorangium sp. So ce887]|uniref:HNH endonuclease signature motif containing protein n=1 Tax=Sorangium sp. So ce887 TaxID=3133324 RepID=UPI003F6414EE
MTLAAHEVDHLVALKHGGATLPENLALSCVLCNKHKGTDLASIDGETGDWIARTTRTTTWNRYAGAGPCSRSALVSELRSLAELDGAGRALLAWSEASRVPC